MANVLVVTTSYPTRESPAAGSFVREHARSVGDRHRVAILHLERTPGLRGLRIERDHGELPLVRVRFPERPTALSYAALLAAGTLGFRAVRRAGFDPDLLHAHFLTAAVPATLLGRIRRLPVVVSEHWSVFLPDDPMELSPLLRRAARLAFESAAVVLPVSEALDRGIADHGIQARTRVVPNAVDTALFTPPPPRALGAPMRLLTVALFYEAKGVDLLLKAVARLRTQREDFVLDVVGDGALRGEYEALAQRLGIEGVVKFHGLRTKPEIAEHMREADLYVLPSRFDNNPVALLEALASGLPAVATAVGGVPELVTDPSLLAAPDPAELARTIGGALDRLDTFDRTEIGRRAAERYGTEAVGRALIDVYDEVLARRTTITSYP
jgi:glycosyltransferase involved in cell wall biosynthesis